MGRTEKTNSPTPFQSVEKKGKKKTQANSPKSKLTSRNAARERSRVRSLRSAFQSLQDSLPAIPRHTKLSKLDVLVLAASYIAHLSHALDPSPDSPQCLPAHLHPVRKWPMRSRLYAGVCSNMDECPLDSMETISQADEFPCDVTSEISSSDVLNDALDWQIDESFIMDSTFNYL